MKSAKFALLLLPQRHIWVKFEFTASRGALKFRKPYKKNQFSSSYSETIGPILMIPLADPHENWMPMKCWKNQSSSISQRARTRSYHYVHGPVGHQKLLQMQKFQRETWRQCQEWLRNKYIEPFNLLCARVRFPHCVPLVCMDLKLISCCSNVKRFKGRPGGTAKRDSETKKLNS